MNYMLLFLVVATAVAVEAKTDCEKHRDNAEKIGTIMKLIPKCDEKGDYLPLQCYKDSKFCVCYNKKGHPVSPITSSVKKCDCYQKRHDKIHLNLDNAYIPQCEADGSWVKKQCWEHNNSCWCVHEDGEINGKVKPADASFDC